MPITIRQPTEEEKGVLQAIDCKGSDWPSAKQGSVLTESLKKNTGLGFELLLSSLTTKYQAVAEIDEDELAGDFPAFFSPEIDALRYEILQSKQLKKEAAQVRDKLLTAHPGIRFRLDDADKDMGVLRRAITEQRIRKMKETSDK